MTVFSVKSMIKQISQFVSIERMEGPEFFPYIP